jgi:7-cyano-7-deazaguanine synthase in queuosine biosynthesis
MDKYYALFSGGLDSTLAIIKVMASGQSFKLTPLFFRFGQRSEEKEKEAVSRLIPVIRNYSKVKGYPSVLEDCREYDIKGLFSWSKSPILKHNSPDSNAGNPDVENRNMVLIGCAASVIMSDWKSEGNKNKVKLVVGFKNEHYDTKQRFANSISGVFNSMGQQPISIVTPLITGITNNVTSYHRLTKEAYSLGVLDILKQTWSCYYPENGETCECSACQGRNKFFKELEIRIQKKG